MGRVDKIGGSSLVVSVWDSRSAAGAAGSAFAPKARVATPGSADFCLLSDVPVAEIARHLAAEGVGIIEGPVAKTGATGPLTSIYFRDPDGNLVEVSNSV